MQNLLPLMLIVFLSVAEIKAQQIEPWVKEMYPLEMVESHIVGDEVYLFTHSEYRYFNVIPTPRPAFYRFDLNERQFIDSFYFHPPNDLITATYDHRNLMHSFLRQCVVFNQDSTKFQFFSTFQNTFVNHVHNNIITTSEVLWNHASLSGIDSMVNFDFFDTKDVALETHFLSQPIYKRISPKGAITSLELITLNEERKRANERDYPIYYYSDYNRKLTKISKGERNRNRGLPILRKVIPNKDSDASFYAHFRHANKGGPGKNIGFNLLKKMDTLGNELWRTQLHQPQWQVEEHNRMNYIDDPYFYEIHQRPDNNLLVAYVQSEWWVPYANHFTGEEVTVRRRLDTFNIVLRIYDENDGSLIKEKVYPGALFDKLLENTKFRKDNFIDFISIVGNLYPLNGKLLQNGHLLLSFCLVNTKLNRPDVLNLTFDEELNLINWRLLNPFPERYSAYELDEARENLDTLYDVSLTSIASINEMKDGGFLFAGNSGYYSKWLPITQEWVENTSPRTTFLMRTDEHGCLEPGCQEQDTLIAYWEEKLKTVQREEAQNLDFKLYPNPAQAVFYLELSQELHGKPLQLQVLNLQGQPIHTDNFTASGSRKSIASQNWAAGLYQVVLTTREGEQLRKKLVVY